MNHIFLDEPVEGLHLDYISQFLYTGDYAVETFDVEDFPIDRVKHPNGCSNCVSHLRLLSLHLSIFHVARYLGMELLQLLALDKFACAADHATPTVLRYIVQDVYTIEPQTPINLHSEMYSLAGFLDYRPLMILPAVMNYIRKHRPAIQTHYAAVVTDMAGSRVEMLRAGWSDTNDQFEACRNEIPEFDQHMQWADMVLAQENGISQTLEWPEPTGDFLDSDNLEEFSPQETLQQQMTQQRVSDESSDITLEEGNLWEDFESFRNAYPGDDNIYSG